MDLSRIEAWTREMLEAEARRRGIRNCEFRSRRELVRLILRHQYGDQLAATRERVAKGVRTARQARELFGVAVGAALSSLPEPFETLLRLRSRVPLPDPPESAPWAPPPVPGPSEPDLEPDLEPEPAFTKSEAREVLRPPPPSEPPAPQAVPAVDVNDAAPSGEVLAEAAPAAQEVSAAPDEPVAAAGDAVEAPLAEPEREPPAEPSAAPASAEQPASMPSVGVPLARSFIEEPIRTRSMARLLASQGHQERALAIYEELRARDSTDPEIAREIEALRAGRSLDVTGPLPAPDGEAAVALPQAADRIDFAPGDSAGMRLRWKVTPEGRARAEAVLGRSGELAIRVVTIAPDAERVVRTDITEYGPVDDDGEWTAPARAEHSRCFAAVGVRADDRFVSITHVRA